MGERDEGSDKLQLSVKADLHTDGLTSEQVRELHRTHGLNEVKPKQTPEWQKIAWRYLDWVSLIIIVAAIVSIAVPLDGDRGYTSFTLLIIELNIIVWVGYWTDRNAGNAIKELEELSAPHALAKRDGKWQDVTVAELVPGDLIALKGGDIVPADCVLVGDGEPMKVDESSLTGESLAVTKKPGDKVLAGAVVAQGELDAVITETGADTFFGKTIALLGQREEPGHLQQVLGRVGAFLGLVAAVGVLGIFIAILCFGWGAGLAVQLSFVILASTIPIGMPVVTAAVMAVGAGEMVKEKAIVSRLSALEELSGMEVLCSDKTGTLTLNRLTLDKADIQAWGSTTPDHVLLMASLSAKWTNQDAIDKAVTAAVEGGANAIANWKITRLVPFNPVDKKTLAEVTAPDGRKIVTAKGAPQIIGAMLTDPAAKAAVDRYIEERATRGLRSLGVAESQDGGATWELTGLISLLDPPRPDSAETIQKARALGVEVKMVTGDQHAIAVETCRRLGMGTGIMEGSDLMRGDISLEQLAVKCTEADGFAGVYPEHKFKIVEALQSKGQLIGMTGDGVNDAPALKRANVGIAVAGATAAAKGAADIILTEEGIGTIVTAIIRSRKIFARLQSYIIYRMSSSLTILGFFFFSITILKLDFPTWALLVVNLTNDLSVMATSFDRVHSSEEPQYFDMLKCLAAASAISLIGTGSLTLLFILSDPTKVNWWPSVWGFELTTDPESQAKTNGQTIAVLYMALTAYTQLSIFLTRTPSFFLHVSKHTAPPPSLMLCAPVALFIVGSMFLSVYWPSSIQPDGGFAVLVGAGWRPVLISILYVVVMLLVADTLKVVVLRLVKRHSQVKEKCEEEGVPPPAWVSAVEMPSNVTDAIGSAVEATAGRVATAILPHAPNAPTTHASYIVEAVRRRSVTLQAGQVEEGAKLERLVIHKANEGS